MWLHYLALAVAIIGISYGLSVWSFSAFLEDQGIYQGEDGRFYSRYTSDEEVKPKTFTYTLKDCVCEAFQVGNDLLPSWVNDAPMDVVISEPQHVLLRKEGGKCVTVPKGAWIVRCSDDSYYALDDEHAKEYLVKIEIGEA